jgi:cytidine deaminase
LQRLSNEIATHLLQLATDAQSCAYAPYSKYKVGSAVLTAEGGYFVGANVENQSFGGTICAERAAICSMVSGGHRKISAIAVVTPDAGFPCGICLQVINEFKVSEHESFIVMPPATGRSPRIFTLFELAPHLWSSDSVKYP